MGINWVINIDCSNTFFIKSICKFCGSPPIANLIDPTKISKEYVRLSDLLINKLGSVSLLNLSANIYDKTHVRFVNIHKASAVSFRVKKINKGSLKDNTTIIRHRMCLNTSVSKNFNKKNDFFGSDLMNVSNVISCKCMGTFWIYTDSSPIFNRTKLSFVIRSINILR